MIVFVFSEANHSAAVGGEATEARVESVHVNPRFLPTSVGRNLGLTWKFPTTAERHLTGFAADIMINVTAGGVFDVDRPSYCCKAVHFCVDVHIVHYKHSIKTE